MIEAFGAGTAAIVAPCELIHFNGVDYKIPLDRENPKAQIGKLTERLANTVMSIQVRIVFCFMSFCFISFYIILIYFSLFYFIYFILYYIILF
jgi:hypothetical protein